MATDSLDGLVQLRRDLLADGYSDDQIRKLVRLGTLRRIRHGAYVEGPVWDSLTAYDRHRVLVRAVLRTAHPSAVASHSSSAVEHGGPVWGIDLSTVHLTRLDGRLGRREAGVVQHRGQLTADEVQHSDGIKVTVPSRCAVEVISITSAESALVTVNGLLHQELMTREDLSAAVRRHRHWPSTLSSAIVLRLCDERVQSVGESRTQYLCYTQHLPRPEPQVEIRDERGWLIGQVDFAWPHLGVFLEFHGKEKYTRFRRPGETLEEYLMREKRRIEEICQLTGWICIPITWHDLQNPERTAARIRRILHSRQPAGA